MFFSDQKVLHHKSRDVSKILLVLFHMKNTEKTILHTKTIAIKSKIRPFCNCDVMNYLWRDNSFHSHV